MDDFGKILAEKAREAGVNVNYMVNDKEPTGTCAVCITGKHRLVLDWSNVLKIFLFFQSDNCMLPWWTHHWL